MADTFSARNLGKSKLTVGPLGIAGGYGAPAEACEEAFERGCNYFYHGSVRKDGMTAAIKNIIRKGQRDKLILVGQIYTRWSWQEGRRRSTGPAASGSPLGLWTAPGSLKSARSSCA